MTATPTDPWRLSMLIRHPLLLAGLAWISAVVDAPARAAGPPVGQGPAPQNDSIVLQDFNGPALPRNREGNPYPYQYPGAGTATVSLDRTDAVAGNSVRFDVASGGLYAQFNPNSATARGFARDYSANPAGWRFNTYNRLSFWIKRPTTASPLITDGRHGTYVGTYVKQVTNPDPRSDEAGGSHYYHSINVPNNGQWTLVILNMHPDHRRGDGGGDDPGVLAHPTDEPRYNYFDALTRFYIDDTANPRTGAYRIDEVRFYREAAAENDAQVASLTGTHDPAHNRLIVTWNRPKDENNTRHEVRYSFTDIHQIGWKAATPAPRGVIAPPGWQGYNGMVYDTTALPLAGRRAVYVAVKPQDSPLFSQIAVPLRGGGRP